MSFSFLNTFAVSSNKCLSPNSQISNTAASGTHFSWTSFSAAKNVRQQSLNNAYEQNCWSLKVIRDYDYYVDLALIICMI